MTLIGSTRYRISLQLGAGVCLNTKLIALRLRVAADLVPRGIRRAL